MNVNGLIFFLSIGALFACDKDEDLTTDDSAGTVVKVNSAHFLTAGLAEPISIVSKALSNGTTADCYQIVTKSTPSDHAQGPWCPVNITDDASKGGIWLEGGNVYDVDGAFIKNLATFYKDNTWQMYNPATGAITRTTTQAECQAAANCLHQLWDTVNLGHTASASTCHAPCRSDRSVCCRRRVRLHSRRFR